MGLTAILGRPPPSTSGLGRHPFKVVARVRIPLGASSSSVSLLDPWPLWSDVSRPPAGRLLPWGTTNWGKQSERRVQSPELPGTFLRPGVVQAQRALGLPTLS